MTEIEGKSDGNKDGFVQTDRDETDALSGGSDKILLLRSTLYSSEEEACTAGVQPYGKQ